MLSLKALRGQLSYHSSNWRSSVGGESTRPCADPPSPVIKGVKGQICCTSEIPVAFFEWKEPAIILKNNSSNQVSFWVIEEDRTKPTKAALDKISKKMGAPVEQDNPTTPSTTREGSEDGYVLTADHRVDKCGTTVPFLKGSNSMRVLGFFRKDSSETWRLYKNKVYSIRRGKKIFTLVATDENIGKHQQLKTSDMTENNKKSVAVSGQTEGGELDKIN